MIPPSPTHRSALLPACALALMACGTEPQIPDAITSGNVSVESDPLAIVITSPREEIRVSHFISIGQVAEPDRARYYDPARPPESLSWQIPERAVAYDASDDALILPGGTRLSLREHPGGAITLAVDSSSDPTAVLTRLSLPRRESEPIFGFGESFDSPIASGVIREMQLQLDSRSESSTNEVHAPVPLALWPARGLGLFVEDPRPAAFDVGSSEPDRVQATFALTEPGPVHAHFFTAAPPLELLRTYARLTSLPAVPPLWAFAPQQWRNAHDSSDEIIQDAEAMRSLGIPTGVMWIDNPWQTQYNSFVFDEQRFADIDSALATLQALGYSLVVWSTPYVNTELTSDYSEARQRGFLVTDDVGVPFVFPWQDGPGSLVDFSADGATDWWRERIARATSLGVVGFKLDFGEDLLPAIGGNLTPFALAAGTAQTMHKQYSSLYHEAYLGAPGAGGFTIARSGSFGGQAHNTCIWPGDLDSDMSRHGTINEDGTTNVGGLPAAIAGGLSLSVSGYPFYGSDIGGFREGPPTTETLLRWAQYASLGTIMQLGGGGRSHNPWDNELFDLGAAEIYRQYARLHMDLIPLIYSLAEQAGRDGTPVTRPTRFVYPNALSDDATFLLGDSLFVAPVIEPGATSREVVLPPGEWVDWWTGDLTESDGTGSIVVSAPLETLPLWRRRAAAVPMFARSADTFTKASDPAVTSYADRELARELRVVTSLGQDRASVTLWDGASATIDHLGSAVELDFVAGSNFDVITFELDGSVADWQGPAVTQGGSDLPAAGDREALESCAAPGCFLVEGDRLSVRVWAADGHASATATP